MLFSSIDNYLFTGNKFPFKEEEERINQTIYNYLAFVGRYGEIPFFQEQFKRCEEDLDQWNQTLYNVLPINYNQQICNDTINLVFNKEPTINVQIQENYINTIKEASLQQLIYGLSLTHTLAKEGKIQHTNIDPTYYYPVFNPLNVNEITQECVIIPIGDILSVDIHTIGFSEHREYKFKDNKIGNLLKQTLFNTGLKQNALTVIKRNIGISDPYGISLFDAINDSIAQIIVSQTQISRVLDKNVDPMLVIPESAVEYDEYDNAYYKAKKALIVKDKDQARPERITWDGQLTSAFKNLDIWKNNLAYTSGLGKLIMENYEQLITGLSGEALRKMNSKAITTVNGIRQNENILIQKTLLNEYNLQNKGLPNIEIKWEDLFEDSKTEKLDYATKMVEAGFWTVEQGKQYLTD